MHSHTRIKDVQYLKDNFKDNTYVLICMFVTEMYKWELLNFEPLLMPSKHSEGRIYLFFIIE